MLRSEPTTTTTLEIVVDIVHFSVVVWSVGPIESSSLAYSMLSVWRAFSTGNQSSSFSSSRSQEDKLSASNVAHRQTSDADVDGATERVGEFTVWFDDFTRFDQQLHLLIDLGVFTDGDEQLLLLLKVLVHYIHRSLFQGS